MVLSSSRNIPFLSDLDPTRSIYVRQFVMRNSRIRTYLLIHLITVFEYTFFAVDAGFYEHALVMSLQRSRAVEMGAVEPTDTVLAGAVVVRYEPHDTHGSDYSRRKTWE